MLGRTVRTAPISHIDPGAAQDLINEAIMSAKLIDMKRWMFLASDDLKKYGIFLAPSSLEKIDRKLLKGQRTARSASLFRGKAHSRCEKNRVGGQVDIAVKFFIEDDGYSKDYLGLPANQIIDVIRKYDNVVACETNKKTYSDMCRLKEIYCPTSNALILQENIIEYMFNTENKYTIIELDLMEHLNSIEKIEHLGASIRSAGANRVVVCITSCLGRKVSSDFYKEHMPKYLIRDLEREYRVKVYNNKYADSTTTMKYEILILDRVRL